VFAFMIAETVRFVKTPAPQGRSGGYPLADSLPVRYDTSMLQPHEGRGLPTGICVPVARPGPITPADLRRLARGADLLELRLDLIREYDLPTLLRARPCPIVVTNRPRREGGAFVGSEERRLMPLRQAMELNADYVDVEWDSLPRLGPRPSGSLTALVVSRHLFAHTPPDPLRLVHEMAGMGADVVKLATMVWWGEDNIRLLDCMAQAPVRVIIVGMGPVGLPTRVLALRAGSLLTYAARPGQETASGQLSLSEMDRLFAVRTITPSTRIIAWLVPWRPPRRYPRALISHLQKDNARLIPFPVTGDPLAIVRALATRGITTFLPHRIYRRYLTTVMAGG